MQVTSTGITVLLVVKMIFDLVNFGCQKNDGGFSICPGMECLLLFMEQLIFRS